MDHIRDQAIHKEAAKVLARRSLSVSRGSIKNKVLEAEVEGLVQRLKQEKKYAPEELDEIISEINLLKGIKAKIFSNNLLKRISNSENDRHIPNCAKFEITESKLHQAVDALKKVIDENTSHSVKETKLLLVEEMLYKPLIQGLGHTSSNKELKLLSTALYHAGKLHKTLGDITKQPGCYTFSAVLCNYALAIINHADDGTPSNKHEKDKIYESLDIIQDSVISTIVTPGEEGCVPFQPTRDFYRDNHEYLRELRDNTKSEILKLDKYLLNNSLQRSLDALGPVRELYYKISTKMIELLSQLYEQAEYEIGQPPCGYSVIGLGSMALKQITPYSDFEFAILVENDEYKSAAEENYKRYFINLTHLVNLKLINLGETVIPFSKYNVNLDRLIPFGISLDLGGKTPLGNNLNEAKYELVQTIEGMLEYVYDKHGEFSKIDINLPKILTTICFVYGNKDLVLKYQQGVEIFLNSNAVAVTPEAALHKGLYRSESLVCQRKANMYMRPPGYNAASWNDGDLDRFRPLSFEDFSNLLDVKKEIYRLADRFIYDLGLYYGKTADGTLSIIEKLLEASVINKEAAKNLQFAALFSLMLRLKVYTMHDCQEHSMTLSQIASLSQDSADKIPEQKLAGDNKLCSKSNVFDYFYVILPLYERLEEFYHINKQLSSAQRKHFFENDLFYAKTDKNTGLIHYRLFHYIEAVSFLHKALQEGENKGNLDLRNILGKIYIDLGEIDQAIAQFKYCLDALSVSKDEADEHDCTEYMIAEYQYNLGIAYYIQKKYEQAKTLHDSSLRIREGLPAYDQNKGYLFFVNNAIADSLEALSLVHARQQQTQTEAIKLSIQSLSLRNKIYGTNINPGTAQSLHNIGNVYMDMHKYEKALEYLLLGLEIRLIIYNNATHLHILESCISISKWFQLDNKITESASYAEEALAVAARLVKHPIYNAFIEDNSNLLKLLATHYSMEQCEFTKSIHEFVEGVVDFKGEERLISEINSIGSGLLEAGPEYVHLGVIEDS